MFKYNTKVVLEIQEAIGEYRVVEKSPDFYCDEVEFACGPSNAEQGLQASSSSFANLLQSTYGTSLANQNVALGKLNSVLQQIQSGTTVPGFGASENAALRSQIVDNSAAAARNNAQSVQDFGAGKIFRAPGGGYSTDSSGLARSSAIQQQLREEAGSAAETQKSNALLGETAANYATGRENAIATASGLKALAGEYGSQGDMAAQGAIKSNENSFNQAKDINQQRNQMSSDIMGLATGAVKTGLGAVSGGLTNLGDGGWDLGAFSQGALGALSGNNG